MSLVREKIRDASAVGLFGLNHSLLPALEAPAAPDDPNPNPNPRGTRPIFGECSSLLTARCSARCALTCIFFARSCIPALCWRPGRSRGRADAAGACTLLALQARATPDARSSHRVSARSFGLAARRLRVPRPLLVRPSVQCRLRAGVWCGRQHVRQRLQGPSGGCGVQGLRGRNVYTDLSARANADADPETDSCADTYAHSDADTDADAHAHAGGAPARRVRVEAWCPRGLRRHGRSRRRALPQRRPRCRLRQPVLAAGRASAGELTLAPTPAPAPASARTLTLALALAVITPTLH